MSEQQLLKTPLHAAHLERGARMVDFAGWSMPVFFAGIKEEHLHTRKACSLFDVSHMGRLKLTGADCATFVDRLNTRNLAAAEIGRSYYSHICREDGGILDDVIVSRFEDGWGIVCNASNHAKIVDWINKQSSGFTVSLTDETTATAMFALQGPMTMEVVNRIAKKDLSDVKRYGFTFFDYLGARIFVYRCGYTGEDGLEVVLPAGLVPLLLPFLLGSPHQPHDTIKPAGLGARDTLRIEAGMPLYGHELHEEVDSLSAGQSWCVDLSTDFIGAEALRAKKEGGLSRQMVGLGLEGKRIARQHYDVLHDGKSVGEITSGTLSPTLEKSIAMAYVAPSAAEPGTKLEVDLNGKKVPAEVVKLPFYRRPTPA